MLSRLRFPDSSKNSGGRGTYCSQGWWSEKNDRDIRHLCCMKSWLLDLITKLREQWCREKGTNGGRAESSFHLIRRESSDPTLVWQVLAESPPSSKSGYFICFAGNGFPHITLDCICRRSGVGIPMHICLLTTWHLSQLLSRKHREIFQLLQGGFGIWVLPLKLLPKDV